MHSILDKQFDLSYYVCGFSFLDTESMSSLELDEMYKRLSKRKEDEYKARNGN